MENLLELASKFVNQTNAHIYLTGKAGTGKTTFLRNLAKSTHKRFAIVAPTGIAALNAKGVTIHSQFLLPLGLFVPVDDASGNISESSQVYTKNTLIRKNPLNALRKQVLRDIDLLIIDEVSMLRADVLDAIDFRLKSVKRNYNVPFGGVQLLMIGDLFQLPPIVRDHEWHIMKEYYKSAFFFDSLVLQESGFVYLELEKIFRQDDARFISLLNNLRNNTTTREDIEILNQHFQPESERKDLEGVITLTTHNRTADQMNQKALSSLPGKSFYYSAEIDKDFPESMYPVDETLDLKAGTQVMFIKNDNQDGKYFNGKIAKVTKLDKERVTVEFEDTKEAFVLRKETWENRKYTVDAETKELEEEIIGSFSQYPIKLAWAITVHKSQGLTFDKAIIDVGRAFAPGQVYVALSRLRSLDGLILGTRIQPSVISSDNQVVNFSQRKETQPKLSDLFDIGKRQYLDKLVQQTFDFSGITGQVAYSKRGAAAKMEFTDESMRSAVTLIENRFFEERENTLKFQRQLSQLLVEGDKDKLLSRIKSGSGYYTKMLKEAMKQMLKHISDASQFSRTKTYVTAMQEIDQLIMMKLVEVHNAAYITEQVLLDKEVDLKLSGQEKVHEERKSMVHEIEASSKANPKAGATKTGKKKKATGTKGETYQKTLALIKEGLTPEQIAEKRGMSEGTIEGHIAKFIGEGTLPISNFIGEEEVKNITETLQKVKSVTETVKAHNNDFTYGQVRMVQALLKEKE
jgi:DNA-binding NarL/FixJ family response regulator